MAIEKFLEENEDPSSGKTTFYKDVNVKRVLLCLHGLQTSTTHDLTEFKKYFDEVNPNPNWEVVLVDLYKFGDKKTYGTKNVVRAAEKATEEYLNKGYVVYVLAYSFSASIGARLCVLHPEIEKLVLVSPTIYVLRTGLMKGYIKLFIKHLKFNHKYKKKLKKKKNMAKIVKSSSKGFPKLIATVTGTVWGNRKYCKLIQNKVFVSVGKEDELCIPSTFTYISKKSKSSVSLSKIYPSQNHTMIYNRDTGLEAYKDILYFLFHIAKNDEDADIE